MKRREPTPSDRAALTRAARSERAARERWESARDKLEETIKRAAANGASLRVIAELVGRSHGRVRQILLRR